MKTKTTLKRLASALIFLGSTFSFAQCPLGNSFASAVAPTTLNMTQNITSCSFYGEYSTVNGIVGGNVYVINISATGVVQPGYITVYDMTSTTPIVFGSAPLTFIAPATGSYRFQWNGDSCAVVNSCHTSSITLVQGTAQNCNGQVTPGNAISSSATSCPSVPFTLSLNGASQSVGITYQWQSSPDGITYTNIQGATNQTYSATQSNSNFYQCIVTCNSGTSGTSSAVEVTANTAQNCICTPVYSQGCLVNDLIARVIVNTLDNISGATCLTGALGYSDYTSDSTLTTTFVFGNSYNVEIWCGSYAQSYAVWIDYNDNGVFEHPAERIGYTSSTGSGQSGVIGNSGMFSFLVDPASVTGDLRMRVRSVYANAADLITPCGQYTWGETEDYMVTVVNSNDYACISGSVYCDNNNNGMLDSSDVSLATAPFTLNYNGQSYLTTSDANGNYSFGFSTDSTVTSATITVDPAWLAQNGIQYTTNSITTTQLTCSQNNPTIDFAVNCDSSDIQTSCLYGWAFCDANANGSLDTGEVAIPNAPINLSNGVTVFSDANGFISYAGGQNPSGVLTASISNLWLNQNGFAIDSNSYTVSTDCNNPTPFYFAVNCSPVLCSNLWTTVSPWIGYFQNYNNTIKLKWGNNGPNATSGYILTLTFPAGVTPNTSSFANQNYTISGNTISWTITGNNNSTNTDFISFYVPGGLPSGTPHTYTSTITAIGAVGDCDSTNNNGMLTMILGSSYDPNDKAVSHPPMIDPDTQQELTYVIRFQNTGTAPAQDVYIIDSLSANLDWSSLKIDDVTHYMQLIDLGNGVMKFNFPGIWLADSTTNEAESHGHVVFSIKENAFNPVNSVIENTAYIYFDWNEPIVTNTTYNINAYPVSGLDELGGNVVNVYPNPFSSNVHIVSAKLMESITVFDITGQEIYSETVNSLNKSIDLTLISQGVYLVKVNSGGLISTVRIVKK